MGVDEPYAAYCLDQAVSAWGGHITSELEKIEGKDEKKVAAKRQRRLLQLLQAPTEVRFKSLRNPSGAPPKK
jgi:hypothetical protein